MLRWFCTNVKFSHLSITCPSQSKIFTAIKALDESMEIFHGTGCIVLCVDFEHFFLLFTLFYTCVQVKRPISFSFAVRRLIRLCESWNRLFTFNSFLGNRYSLIFLVFPLAANIKSYWQLLKQDGALVRNELKVYNLIMSQRR